MFMCKWINSKTNVSIVKPRNVLHRKINVLQSVLYFEIKKVLVSTTPTVLDLTSVLHQTFRGWSFFQQTMHVQLMTNKRKHLAGTYLLLAVSCHSWCTRHRPTFQNIIFTSWIYTQRYYSNTFQLKNKFYKNNIEGQNFTHQAFIVISKSHKYIGDANISCKKISCPQFVPLTLWAAVR